MFVVNRTDQGSYKFYSNTLEAYICKGKVNREQYGIIALPKQDFEEENFDESQCLFDIQDHGMQISSIWLRTHLLFC